MSRQLRHSSLIFAVVLASAAAAYVMADEAAGTIRSVDAKSRTLSLRVDQKKTLELTISRKAKVSLDGKEGPLEGLRSGQQAVVTYAADAEIATDIKATSDPNAEDESVTDAKWLQGEWVSIGEWSGGKELTKAELKEMNKRLSVKGNKFVIKRVVQAKLGTYDGRFELDGSTDPKQFNWTGKGAKGEALELEGIYEVDKDLDQFKMCYVRKSSGEKSKPRPTSFETNEAIRVTYKRDKK